MLAGLLPPENPWLDGEIDGDAEAIFPAISFWRSTARCPPAPDSCTSAGASVASTYCSGGASDEPPWDTSEKITSSFLKSVGLNQASTPLLKRTTVTPSASFSRRSLITPGVGSPDMSAAVAAASFHGVTSTFS